MTSTIGQRLKNAREEKRLTLEKVFEATRIRVQYLQALEADDLSVMPSPVQARGYLRNYAEYLGFDVEKMLEELRRANAQKPSEEVTGPADIASSEETRTPEPVPPNEEAPAEATPVLVKPKPVRRKKSASSPTDGPDSFHKDQSQKQAEPGLEFQIEPPDVPSDPSAEQEKRGEKGSSTRKKKTPQPHKSLDKESIVSFLEDSRKFQESVPANVPPPPAPVDVSTAEEPSSAANIRDNLWQMWLNRLGSRLAARNKRRTLVPKEPVALPEVEAGAVRPVGKQPQGIGGETSPASEDWREIFKEIGRELRERRELLSLHLEEVERNTHVKAHYLDALERGAMDDLPSTVQTRGMLSNYATFLDLDVDVLLLRFADALQARHRERNPQKPARRPGQPILANLPPMRSFIAGDLIFGVGIIVLLVGFAIWGVSRVLTLQGQQDVNPTAPSISEILLASPEPGALTATPTAEVIEAFPGEPSVTVVIPTLNANVNVQVNLVAVERTYMRVIVDGETVFEGRVVPGTAYPFEAVDQVEVLVGSGAAIRIVYNGRDLGLLGSFGQVVSNIYRAGEIITPTGIPTATATVTPTPTNTAPPSATSQFTVTPVTATPVFTNTAVP
jgi:cytoskeleton protein RodZ